jgi:hypothetical protein
VRLLVAHNSGCRMQCFSPVLYFRSEGELLLLHISEKSKMDARRHLEVIEEEDDEQRSGLRIVSISSMVDTPAVSQPDEDTDGFMRIVRRPIKPRSQQSRSGPRSGRDALISRGRADEDGKKVRKKKALYSNTAPATELTCFAM